VPVDALPAASTYALVRSSLACPATASPAWIVPPTIPGGNPVTEARGASMPRSLLTVVGPVFVTVVWARIEKLRAVPRGTVGVAAFPVCPAIAPIAITNARAIIAMSVLWLFMVDAPLDGHAPGVPVSASYGRACGRSCHDRSVTHDEAVISHVTARS
jgi:hypothetical protein